jgi:hypothetical protein
MKIKKYITQTIVTTLLDVEEHIFKSKNGNESVIVILKTKDGSFSNYKTVWEKCNINLVNMPDDNQVEITYSIYKDERKNRDFKNFSNVKLV